MSTEHCNDCDKETLHTETAQEMAWQRPDFDDCEATDVEVIQAFNGDQYTWVECTECGSGYKML